MSNKEEAYLQLMRDNRARIYRIARVYSNNPQDLKDLSQEIAYQVWKSFDSFRNESARSTWLHRIAINTALQYLRRQKRRPDQTWPEGLEMVAEETAPPESNDREIRQLMHAIQQLKELDKAIVLLYLEEKSHAEISAIVNLSVSNVGTRIQRIKQKLNRILTEPNHGPR